MTAVGICPNCHEVTPLPVTDCDCRSHPVALTALDLQDAANALAHRSNVYAVRAAKYRARGETRLARKYENLSRESADRCQKFRDAADVNEEVTA